MTSKSTMLVDLIGEPESQCYCGNCGVDYSDMDLDGLRDMARRRPCPACRHLLGDLDGIDRQDPAAAFALLTAQWDSLDPFLETAEAGELSYIDRDALEAAGYDAHAVEGGIVALCRARCEGSARKS